MAIVYMTTAEWMAGLAIGTLPGLLPGNLRLKIVQCTTLRYYFRVSLNNYLVLSTKMF